MLSINATDASQVMSQLRTTITALKEEVERRDTIWSELLNVETQLAKYTIDGFRDNRLHLESRSVDLRQQLAQSMRRIQNLVE